jgi:hypothetical protein
MWARANNARKINQKNKADSLSKRRGNPNFDKKYRRARERSSLTSDANQGAISLLRYVWAATKQPSVRERYPQAFKNQVLKTPTQSFTRRMGGNYEAIRRGCSKNTQKQNLVCLIMRLMYFLKNIGINSEPLRSRKCRRSDGYSVENPERKARKLARQLKIHLQTFTPSNWNRYFDSHLRVRPSRRREEDTLCSVSEYSSELSSELSSLSEEEPGSKIPRGSANLEFPSWMKLRGKF